MSTAAIAVKNWKSILMAENATLVAVASREESKARQFIDHCQQHAAFQEPPKALGSYEGLLNNDLIDAVYIPLPTAIRKDWVIRAANAGKHVLCEKPCAVSISDLREMVDACKQNDVQFMDGVMFMHSGRMEKIREAIDDGVTIGDLKRVVTQFSFRGPDEFFSQNIRGNASTEPAGCLGDLGWYAIRFALFAVNWQMPTSVRGTLLNVCQGETQIDRDVPIEFSGELFFDKAVSASFYCSFLTGHQQLASVSGTKGNLLLKDFVVPFYGSEVSFETDCPISDTVGCDLNLHSYSNSIGTREYGNSAANSQETNMFRTFSANVLSGKPDAFWPDVAMQTQQVMDACLISAKSGGELVTI